MTVVETANGEAVNGYNTDGFSVDQHVGDHFVLLVCHARAALTTVLQDMAQVHV